MAIDILTLALAKKMSGSSGGSAIQSDWNQNDPTAPDYVKNRPFYTGDPVETVVIEEQTVEVGSNLYVTLNGVFAFEVGETYKVKFNGAQYECVAWAANALDYESVIVGNGSIYGGDGGNGEPFSLEYAEGANFLNVSEEGNYAVGVSTLISQVHKLDSKYLPENILTLSRTEMVFPIVKIFDLDAISYILFSHRLPDLNDGDTFSVPKELWDSFYSLAHGYPVFLYRTGFEYSKAHVNDILDDFVEIQYIQDWLHSSGEKYSRVYSKTTVSMTYSIDTETVAISLQKKVYESDSIYTRTIEQQTKVEQSSQLK